MCTVPTLCSAVLCCAVCSASQMFSVNWHSSLHEHLLVGRAAVDVLTSGRIKQKRP